MGLIAEGGGGGGVGLGEGEGDINAARWATRISVCTFD